MTSDHGFYISNFGDPYTPADRVRLLAEYRGYTTNAQLAIEAGVSEGQLSRFYDQKGEPVDEFMHLLQRVAVVLRVDSNYFHSSSPPMCNAEICDRRLRLFEIANRFCKTVRLESSQARRFIIALMNRFEPVFQKQLIGVHSETVPDSQDEVASYYRVWERQSHL